MNWAREGQSKCPEVKAATEKNREIHIPDSLTGFCYKCGKKNFIYGKFCDEVNKGEQQKD